MRRSTVEVEEDEPEVAPRLRPKAKVWVLAAVAGIGMTGIMAAGGAAAVWAFSSAKVKPAEVAVSPPTDPLPPRAVRRGDRDLEYANALAKEARVEADWVPYVVTRPDPGDDTQKNLRDRHDYEDRKCQEAGINQTRRATAAAAAAEGMIADLEEIARKDKEYRQQLVEERAAWQARDARPR